MNVIPDSFSRTIVELHGKAGLSWLHRLPSLIADCKRRWSLRILLPPFEPLSYNYVAPALREDGTEVVLKLGLPTAELTAEIEAIRLVDGRGMVRLLEADTARGALLLERLKPGKPLSSVDDAEATSIAVEVMCKLWRPVPSEHAFPTVAQWASGITELRRRFNGGSGPFPHGLVERAERLFDELMRSMGGQVVLHGDLHHGNILAAERQPWLAIDPKGVVGEAEYELGALLRNPMPQLLMKPHPERILARRVDQLAEGLSFDRARIVGWGLAQAVLAAWWSLEDHGRGWEPWITCARILERLQ